MVHRASGVMSRSYVMVGKNPKKPGQPLVTGEDPRQVVHESDPTNPRDLLAAMKTWWDDIGSVFRAELYLPDRTYYFVSDEAVKQTCEADKLWTPSSWKVDTSKYSEGYGVNEYGEIMLVPFINRPDLAGNGMGEFEDVLDIIDRINNVMLDRLVISAMQAYRQRWATGVDTTDENGAAQNDFDPGADLLWMVDDASAKFGEFSPTDITPIVKAIESDVQYLAAITRTPPHYLLAAITNASGDALASAETGLVSKIGERETEWGESWEEVYRLVGLVTEQPVPDDSEVVWADPQYRSLAERSAAAVQQRTAGVPWRATMEVLGKSPQEIDRLEAMRIQDAMLSDQLATLSIAEGGELGTRGVSYKTTPTDATGPTPPSPATPIAPGSGGKPAPKPPAMAGAGRS
jgi:hypothetical protein